MSSFGNRKYVFILPCVRGRVECDCDTFDIISRSDDLERVIYVSDPQYGHLLNAFIADQSSRRDLITSSHESERFLLTSRGV